MTDASAGTRSASGSMERRRLRGELLIVLPFFLTSLYFFLGSFRYKHDAAIVPMLVGAATAVVTGLRLFHLVVPTSRIGRFQDAGLAGEFDRMKEDIEEEALAGRVDEGPARSITFRDERKAFLALLGACLSCVFFGYVAGMFVTVVGTARAYGYRKKGPLVVTVSSLFVVLYFVLIRLLEAPPSFGLVLTPLLAALGLRL